MKTTTGLVFAQPLDRRRPVVGVPEKVDPPTGRSVSLYSKRDPAKEEEIGETAKSAAEAAEDARRRQKAYRMARTPRSNPRAWSFCRIFESRVRQQNKSGEFADSGRPLPTGSYLTLPIFTRLTTSSSATERM